jgi:sugar diacid utilization regulator
MDWEQIEKKLESILNAPIQMIQLHDVLTPDDKRNSFIMDHSLLFPLFEHNGTVTAFEVDEGLISQSERSLMELMINAYKEQGRTMDFSDEEGKAQQFGMWIIDQIHKNMLNTDLPDALTSNNALYTTKIPLLLYGDDSDNRTESYAELKKLLETFFDEEIILVPLMDNEWLILASESLVGSGSDETKEEEDEETIEEALSSLCSGLYEMMASEWVGECHFAVHYPMIPAKALLTTVMELRETVALGRKYNLGSNIHLAWMLRLERLLNGISESNKQQFMEQVLKGIDHVLDVETLTTLDMFFLLDCNVSETAKKLYIHRNTLLYRLDKFKQETGLDVRNFSHAVLVKITLLLYKVTKRK